MIGTYNSGCAKAMIPILSNAPGGGVAMVSPGNTLICLTQPSPSCGKGEPESLYPERRNYARVVPNDAYQGAGLALFAKQQGVEACLRPLRRRGPDQPRPGEDLPRRRPQAGHQDRRLQGLEPEGASYTGLMRRVATPRPTRCCWPA